MNVIVNDVQFKYEIILSLTIIATSYSGANIHKYVV